LARIDSILPQEPSACSEEELTRKTALVRKVSEEFQAAYSPRPDDEVYAYYVPGRLEVFGKHTDYAGGHSLLFAMDRGFYCVCKANREHVIRLKDVNPSYGERVFNVSQQLEPPIEDWANYPMTVVKRLCKNFGADLNGADITFGSDLPSAGGMSSSSALMIMVFLAVASVNGLFDRSDYRENITDSLDLAMYLACMENGKTFRGLAGDRGVGTFGGSEDHTIILNGRHGMISLYQFAPTLHKADLPMPKDLAYIILYSGARAEKTGEAMRKYNLAARRAKLVVDLYNRAYGTKHLLMRQIVDENKSLKPEATFAKVRRATARYTEKGQDLYLLDRFRQFYMEDQEFIPEAARALALRDYELLARVTNLSHKASKTFIWNISPEVECMRREALRLGALAASGFGAGFGGSAYALIWADETLEFQKRIKGSYRKRFADHAEKALFFQAHPSRGARELLSRP